MKWFKIMLKIGSIESCVAKNKKDAESNFIYSFGPHKIADSFAVYHGRIGGSLGSVINL